MGHNELRSHIDSLWDYDDPAASEEAFRGLIPELAESGEYRLLAELFTQIARPKGYSVGSTTQSLT